MTMLNVLPILERRRIQAEVVKPIYEALKAESGEETAKRVIGDAIIAAAIQEGQEFAREHGENGGIKGFLSFQHLWDADGALETEVITESDTEYVYKVTRCRYAEMYRDMGVGEIGFQLSCNRDGTFVDGYDPRIRFKRTQTIMQGASHCDFHYSMSGDDT